MLQHPVLIRHRALWIWFSVSLCHHLISAASHRCLFAELKQFVSPSPRWVLRLTWRWLAKPIAGCDAEPSRRGALAYRHSLVHGIYRRVNTQTRNLSKICDLQQKASKINFNVFSWKSISWCITVTYQCQSGEGCSYLCVNYLCAMEDGVTGFSL